jgi:hypothetical protein
VLGDNTPDTFRPIKLGGGGKTEYDYNVEPLGFFSHLCLCGKDSETPFRIELRANKDDTVTATLFFKCCGTKQVLNPTKDISKLFWAGAKKQEVTKKYPERKHSPQRERTKATINNITDPEVKALIRKLLDKHSDKYTNSGFTITYKNGKYIVKLHGEGAKYCLNLRREHVHDSASMVIVQPGSAFDFKHYMVCSCTTELVGRPSGMTCSEFTSFPQKKLFRQEVERLFCKDSQKRKHDRTFTTKDRLQSLEAENCKLLEGNAAREEAKKQCLQVSQQAGSSSDPIPKRAEPVADTSAKALGKVRQAVAGTVDPLSNRP